MWVVVFLVGVGVLLGGGVMYIIWRLANIVDESPPYISIEDEEANY